MVSSRSIVLLIGCAVGWSNSSFASSNAGGTIILHANTQIAFTTDATSYCAQSDLATCDLAVSSVPANPNVTTVFFALAAFPSGGSPALTGVTFGIEHDSAKLYLQASGNCADFEVSAGDWPASGSGTALTWDTAQTALLIPLYWFAGYAYAASEPSVFQVVPHPVQGGYFADNAVPAVLDAVEGFGTLGFGMGGSAPCPSPEGEGSGEGNPEDSGSDPSTECSFPLSLSVPESVTLELGGGPTKSTFSGRSVLVEWSESGRVTIASALSIPLRDPDSPRMLTTEQYQSLYGEVPLVTAGVARGQTWGQASMAFNDSIASVQFAARMSYFESLAAGASPRDAARRALQVFHSSGLCDVSSTRIATVASDVSGKTWILEKYFGRPEQGVSLVYREPTRASRSTRMTREAACSLIQSLQKVMAQARPGSVISLDGVTCAIRSNSTSR